MGESVAWQPGDAVVVETRRLILTTLKPADAAADDVARWSGEGERGRNVWKPSIPMVDYLRGLASACDQKLTFAFLATHRASKLPVGYLKAQIDPSDHSLTATTIIGDERFSGSYFGSEATRGMQLFLFENCGVQALRPRVYARNEGTLRILKRFGYTEESRYQEPVLGGATSQVCVFHMSRERWFALKDEMDALVAKAPDLKIE